MTGEYYDQDEVQLISQPLHGALRGNTLVTEDGVEWAITMAADSPDTHLVKFAGLPVPETPAAELAAGYKFLNTAILYDTVRRYSPLMPFGFGRKTHVYLTADHSHYHIMVVANTVSPVKANGEAWDLACTVQSRKAANGALAAPQTILAQQFLSITGIGDGSGYYGQVSTFSPDGTRICIAIHKYATAQHAELGDVRRSLGCAGVWEAVLSGGSANAAPAAVMTQIKTSAQCYIYSEIAAVAKPVSVRYDPDTATGSSSQSTLDEAGNPLPTGQIRRVETLSIEAKVVSEVLRATPQGELEYWQYSWSTESVLGAAYTADSALKVISFRSEYLATSSNSLVGPIGVQSRNFEAIFAADGTVVRWIVKPDDISRSSSLSRSVTQTFTLSVGATAVLAKSILRSYTYSDALTEGYNNRAVWISTPVGSPSESYNKTLDGAPTLIQTLTYKVASNNTAGIFDGLTALGFVAPSGAVGVAGTITLDSNGLPWAAWNPLTNQLTITPGWSWC